MAAEEFIAGLLGAGSGILQGLVQRKNANRRAEQRAQELESQNRLAMIRALLGSENVSAEAKNRLLATVMPEFQQTRQETYPVAGTKATAPAMTLPGTTVPNWRVDVPKNVPMLHQLPDKGFANPEIGEYINVLNNLGVSPTTDIIDAEIRAREAARMNIPVALATRPRGTVGQTSVALKSGPDYTGVEEVTEPMQVFQDMAKTPGVGSLGALFNSLKNLPETAQVEVLKKIGLEVSPEDLQALRESTQATARERTLLGAFPGIASTGQKVGMTGENLANVAQQAGLPLDPASANAAIQSKQELDNLNKELLKSRAIATQTNTRLQQLKTDRANQGDDPIKLKEIAQNYQTQLKGLEKKKETLRKIVANPWADPATKEAAQTELDTAEQDAAVLTNEMTKINSAYAEALKKYKTAAPDTAKTAPVAKKPIIVPY